MTRITSSAALCVLAGTLLASTAAYAGPHWQDHSDWRSGGHMPTPTGITANTSTIAKTTCASRRAATNGAMSAANTSLPPWRRV